ncbi:alpha/beta hydrolase [Sphaerisporangium flaviroseum]|uniref:Alpha/beta hydrolase n=1 Tax=Sphaerisporangium flaviroseum TaxID=509199 RepID=A0ABP7I9V3_9ACTN
MVMVRTPDGVNLYAEEHGSGTPVLFIHEFAGDHRSWAPQVGALATRYRCITYSARGYPPSDVPEDPADYSQRHAVADAIAVLDALEVDRAHVVGLSMGGFCTLHLGLEHPERVRSMVVAACGWGSAPDRRSEFRAECEHLADSLRAEGMAKVAERYALGPTRVQLAGKDPLGWRRFAGQLAEHSAVGSANTQLSVQRERPPLYELADRLAGVDLPALVIAGDEDEGCLEPGLMLKRTLPRSGLLVLPKTGHTVNLEEPDAFNRAILEFLAAVEAGRWGRRDPRARGLSSTGLER